MQRTIKQVYKCNLKLNLIKGATDAKSGYRSEYKYRRG